MTPRRRPARALPGILIAIALVGIGVIVFLALQRPTLHAAGGSVTAPTTHPSAPDPALSPAEAVTAVLAALRDNSTATDDGIRTTFRFASPANQAVTGPVDHFIDMVKRPPYAALVNHRAASVRPLDVNGQRAALLVTVIDRDGLRAHFLWVLSKQADGPQKDCWMTDAVSPARPPPDERDDAERV
jgi:hypothetical protein